MPCERKLEGRSEDPDPDVATGLGREHEHRLAEPDLERERLHRLVVQPARVGEDGELVSRQGRVREDVGDDVAERLHRASLRLGRTQGGTTFRLDPLGVMLPGPGLVDLPGRDPTERVPRGRVDQREVQMADDEHDRKEGQHDVNAPGAGEDEAVISLAEPEEEPGQREQEGEGDSERAC